MFSQATIENLKYYVYFLKDPRDNKVFYIGKGKGLRVFEHQKSALDGIEESEKLNKIREIEESGKEVIHVILRHGLTEKESLEVESSCIDLFGLENLTNIQSGHNSYDFGIKTSNEIESIYNAKDFETNHPVVLINLNKTFKKAEKEGVSLYEATRGDWVMGPRRNGAKYGIATFKGLTREVFEIKSWHKKGKRWYFEGVVVTDVKLKNELLYKNTKKLFKIGESSPIKYINC